MERNKVKIICNPYSKTITYKRWGFDPGENDNKWLDLSYKSHLIQDEKYSHATIQHNAKEIITQLDEEYNKGNVGLDIYFDGTKEDFEDLKEVVAFFFREEDIKCEKGDFFLESAEVIMPQIQDVFRNLVNLFSEYNSKEITEIIGKFLNTTKTEIPICVFGTYSTGKSAFINALIGEEILPSSENPTTACNYKIIESDNMGKIRFENSAEKVEIHYDGSQYNIEGHIDKELKEKICEILEEKTENNLLNNLYYSLCVINEYANKTKRVSELIEVEVPFQAGIIKNRDYKFVIFDTPGSDSESNKKHLEVLKEALGNQTNGLPVLVSTPTKMDTKDVGELLEMVNKIEGNLDLSNAMIVVNQADTVATKRLDNIKDGSNTLLNKWKTNRLYFVSSVIALGSKKENYDDGWIDENYSETFDKNKSDFCNPAGKRYKQLYKYNQIAENSRVRYEDTIGEMTEERQLLYVNSGLHCIETEIVEFAKKYALYNKCAQAQKYLDKAIEYTKEVIDEKKREEEKTIQSIMKKQTDEEDNLLNSLEIRMKSLMKVYEEQYPEHMSAFVLKQNSIGKENISRIIEKSWDQTKEYEKSTRIFMFFVKAKKAYEQEELRIKEKLYNHSREYWMDKKRILQQTCCSLIKENQRLTFDEMMYLEQFVMNIKMPEFRQTRIDYAVGDISKYIIDIFGLKVFRLNKINKNKIEKMFSAHLDYFTVNFNARTIESHKESFEEWSDTLKKGLIRNLANLNPTLRKYAEQLGTLQKEIEEVQGQQKTIVENQEKIKEMFEFKIREEDE